jgi:phenylpropionate dioxygenase-like ring-hydroxylating dioxygenase large terminal subunit
MSSVDDAKSEAVQAMGATGYGRRPQRHHPTLVETGPRTPGGEYVRRYWHPVALASEVGPRPRNLKILGEDLVIFRDGSGRPGLLHRRCAHRGSSLFYGRIEEQGIRCCYHGWLFDVQGRCLEQPCEPSGGARRNQVRQPWYPVQERYGLVFAYLGPPEKMPALPRFEFLENLAAGERIFAECNAGITAYGDVAVNVASVPYNWFQFWENHIDPYHVWILHSTFSDFAQFAQGFKTPPNVEFKLSGPGVVYHAFRDIDGRVMKRIGQCILPNIATFAPVDLEVGPTRTINWAVPVDDTSFVGFTLSVGVERDCGFDALVMTPDGKTWSQMSDDEHQAYPGDFEAQMSQGPITLHTEEHLVQSDRGIVMLRKLVLKQIEAVRQGKDPIGVGFTDSDALLPLVAGNFFL